MGHLKSDGQIRTLTAFQQCSRSMYKVARPMIYSEFVVSLYGMRKIRMSMHGPTAGFYGKYESASEKDKPKVEDDAWKMVDADETEGNYALEDLEAGPGDMWFKLGGSKRLRFNLRSITSMRLVEVSKRGVSTFLSRGEGDLERDEKKLQPYVEDNWVPMKEGRTELARPFHLLKELHIEAECLGQMYPTRLAGTTFGYAPWRYKDYTQDFERMVLLRIDSFAHETRLSTLRVDLPPTTDDSKSLQTWHKYDHAMFWDYIRRIGAHCDNYEVRDINACCVGNLIFPRTAKNFVFTTVTGNDPRRFSFDNSNTFDRVMDMFAGPRIGEDTANFRLPKSILWKVTGENTTPASVVNLKTFHERVRNDDNHDGSETLREGAMIAFDKLVGNACEDLFYSALRKIQDLLDVNPDAEVVRDENGDVVNVAFNTMAERELWAGATLGDLNKELRSRINLYFPGLSDDGDSGLRLMYEHYIA